MNSWHDYATCKGKNKADDLFDDDKGVRQEALSDLCSNCPVRYECLQEGLELGERFGVRGGFDQDDLREVQHIDAFGRPLTGKKETTSCLFCDTEIALEGAWTQTVTCPVCELSWEVMFK